MTYGSTRGLSKKLKQWEGSMRTWWNQKVLPSRSREEAFQPIIIILHPVFLYKV